MKKFSTAIIGITLTVCLGIAVRCPNFRNEFAKIAPAAFTALVNLAKEDKPEHKKDETCR